MASPIPGYEITFITKIDLTEDGLKAIRDKIESIVGTFGGEVLYHEDWGKRKLAYPIQKETRAQYTYMVFTGTSSVVAEIERYLRIHESVIRFLTVNLEKEFDSALFMKNLGAGTAMKREERGAEVPGAPIAQPTTSRENYHEHG